MSKKKKIAVSIILFISISFAYLAFYYNFVFARHVVTATLTDINKESNKLTFKMRNTEEFTVISPDIVLPLLVQGNLYHITIYSNKLRPPFIKEIQKVSE